MSSKLLRPQDRQVPQQPRTKAYWLGRDPWKAGLAQGATVMSWRGNRRRHRRRQGPDTTSSCLPTSPRLLRLSLQRPVRPSMSSPSNLFPDGCNLRRGQATSLEGQAKRLDETHPNRSQMRVYDLAREWGAMAEGWLLVAEGGSGPRMTLPERVAFPLIGRLDVMGVNYYMPRAPGFR